jgi:hypothetical protein
VLRSSVAQLKPLGSRMLRTTDPEKLRLLLEELNRG